MSRALIIGLSPEGNTDSRFLSSIIFRTVEELVLEGNQLPEIYDIQIIRTQAETFNEKIIKAATQAEQDGVLILCVHSDADDESDNIAFETRIDPAFAAINEYNDKICKQLVAVVPIYMTESWMLADVDLLKDEIMTEKSNQDLGLTRKPENVANPKNIISTALRIAQEDIPKKKTTLSINNK